MGVHHHRKPHVQSLRIPIKPSEIISNGFIIKDHVVRRWNERVQPNTSVDDIRDIVNKCVTTPGQFRLSFQDYYVLDDEIVCIFERDNEGSVILTSTWGRISNVPALLNISRLIRSMKKYGKINLSLNQ